MVIFFGNTACLADKLFVVLPQNCSVWYEFEKLISAPVSCLLHRNGGSIILAYVLEVLMKLSCLLVYRAQTVIESLFLNLK